MGPYMGEHSLNSISSESIQQIHSQQFLHTPGDGLYQNCDPFVITRYER